LRCRPAGAHRARPARRQRRRHGRRKAPCRGRKRREARRRRPRGGPDLRALPRSPPERLTDPEERMNKPAAPTAPALAPDAAQAAAGLGEARQRLRKEIGKVVVGQDTVLDNLLMALLCRGHVLMLGVPGLGKTLMARTIARVLAMEYRRIQFTPDL